MRRIMMRRMLPAAIAALACLAAPARAATLAEAIEHWTGTTTDVQGSGAHVIVGLPPGSPVPSFTATAHTAVHASDPGWQLTTIVLPSPLRLSGGATLVAASQHASAWLGEATADATGDYAGLALDDRGRRTLLDRAHVAIAAADSRAPVRLDVDLAGLHAVGGSQALIPRHLSLHVHATRTAITSLAALSAGAVAPAAPLTIDALAFEIGEARFVARGTVTIYGPRDRRGEVTLSAINFGALLQGLPGDADTARVYPALMILRGMAHAGHGPDGETLDWVVAFSGDRVLVNGIDIAPLLGW